MYNKKMIYLFAALMCEVRPLINKLGLKSVNDNYWRCFSDGERIEVIVTGTGPVNAAAAVGYKVRSEDIVINFGSCGGDNEGIYLINKIINSESKRAFYPDIFVESEMEEATLMTSSRVSDCADDSYLHDMEAAAIYESAAKFVGPDRMHFIKFVSDNGQDSGKRITPEYVEELASEYTDILIDYIKKIELPIKETNDYWRELSKELCLSETMSLQLKQYLIYSEAASIDMDSVIEKYRSEGRIPASCRREGKRVLDEIRTYICGK